MSKPRSLSLLALLCAFTLPAHAATLHVGESQSFARIGDALAKASAGDEIVVHPLKDHAAYKQEALLVHTSKLTIRAADPKTLIKIDGTGFNYSGKGKIPRAIFQFDPGADGCTLEGFELANARNDSFNGAGVRINQANDITIRRCTIQKNDMGIMSNGELGKSTGARQLIEACTIIDNGSDKEPGYNHNLYLGGTSVTVRACEIARSTTGHNLKSRAHLNWIEYNFIHDSANRELDLVDAKGNTDAENSHAILIGNFIVKAPKTNGNKTVIHFGQDGKNDHTGTLFLVHNTIITPYVSPVVDLSAPGTSVILFNNRIDDANAKGAGVIVNARNDALLTNARGEGNFFTTAFTAKLPATIKAGPLIEWAKIELPFPAAAQPAKRPALLEFLAHGKLEERKTPTQGAGRGENILPAKK